MFRSKSSNIVYSLVVFSFFALLVMLLSGCDDLLEEEIGGLVPENEFWQTEADFDAAMVSAYTELTRNFGVYSLYYLIIEDMTTDYHEGSFREAAEFSRYTDWSAAFPTNILPVWESLWQAIFYCNAVIDNLPGADLDNDYRSRLLGEALGLRAFLLFQLNKWYGPMPLLLSTNDDRLEIPRATIEENYNQIEEDLIQAVALLPDKNGAQRIGYAYGRLNKGACQAILTNAYIEQSKWQQAIDVGTELIDEAVYQLYGDYEDIYSLGNEGYTNTEVIMPFAVVAGEGNNSINSFLLGPYLFRPDDFEPLSLYFDWGDVSVSQSFYNMFEVQDRRRDLLVLDYINGQGNFVIAERPIMVKYPPDPATDGRVSAQDPIIYRLAEIHLYLAEAYNELGNLAEAVAQLNIVQQRANAELTSNSGQSVEDLRETIYNERRKELFFEGKGRSDMARFGTLVGHVEAVSTDAGTNPERYLLLPIPAEAMARNRGLVQNEGF